MPQVECSLAKSAIVVGERAMSIPGCLPVKRENQSTHFSLFLTAIDRLAAQ